MTHDRNPLNWGSSKKTADVLVAAAFLGLFRIGLFSFRTFGTVGYFNRA